MDDVIVVELNEFTLAGTKEEIEEEVQRVFGPSTKVLFLPPGAHFAGMYEGYTEMRPNNQNHPTL